MTLGDALRQARAARQWSLRKVEAETGISNGYLSQMESGKIGEPSPHDLFKLAKALGLDYTHLMELAGYVPPRVGSRKKSVSGLAFSGGDGLTEDEKRQVVDFMDFLRSKRKSDR